MEIQFNIPPGVFRNGTERQSAGRWYNANLVRWYQEEVRPIGGWAAHSPNVPLGAARALITWRDNLASSWIAIGTHTHLYVMNRAGALFDITPTGYISGNADATIGGGWGDSAYGTGTYGTPRLDITNIIDATVWSLDTFGQNLVGCNADDGKIYQWVPPNSGVLATLLPNAPGAASLVVTQERFLMAFGTADPRTVSWSDQQNATVWTASATNQAGSFPLQTFGRIMCVKRLTGATGIWTDTDFWLANYIGGTLVYSFTKASSGCGVASRQAVAVTDAQAAWMGANGFWLYDGYVKPLNCDVHDAVFSNINRRQISKVYAVLNSQFGEVWWFYPSGSSNEIDSYVIWNYRENQWSMGSLIRTAGADAGGPFTYPLMIDNAGTVWEHETGFSYSGQVPFAETGPVEFAPIAQSYGGQGAKVWQATAFIPDERLEGDVNATFITKIYPNGAEISHGPYIMTPQTDVRFTGRQVKLRISGVRPDDWRFGKARLEIKGQGGR